MKSPTAAWMWCAVLVACTNQSTHRAGEPVVSDAPDVRLDAEPSGDVLVGDWELVEVRDGGLEVVIRFHASQGCSRFVGVRVVEERDRVVLAPLALLAPAETEPRLCSAIRTDSVGSVRLETPLGDRRLVGDLADF